jgi:hypothetical protein
MLEIEKQHLIFLRRVPILPLVLLAPTPNLLVETGMQSFTEAKWQFKDAIVCSQNEDVARGVEDRRAYLAMRQMLFYLREQVGIKCSIQITRDVRPDVFAL